MIVSTPTGHFFVCGASEGPTRLNARDGALLQARVGDCNLIRLGFILPPECRLVDPHPLPAGALVPAAWAAITSEMSGEVISAAVAIAYPRDPSRPGVIMEYSARGHKEDAEGIVRRMAEEGLKMRGLEIGDIRSLAVQHRVEQIGSAFAGVVLWDGEMLKKMSVRSE
ncbi:MAG TPA: arginine decarboxylase, pyruvoyl-dependent [Deferrimonas sp.]|jgi:arginine decarboxylase